MASDFDFASRALPAFVGVIAVPPVVLRSVAMTQLRRASVLLFVHFQDTGPVGREHSLIRNWGTLQYM